MNSLPALQEISISTASSCEMTTRRVAMVKNKDFRLRRLNKKGNRKFANYDFKIICEFAVDY